MKTIYRIFPSIGIARLGNSNTTYFLGPESPGIVPQGPYRDESSPGKIKPQVARFRIYEFRRDEFGEETVTRELIPNAENPDQVERTSCEPQSRSRPVSAKWPIGAAPK